MLKNPAALYGESVFITLRVIGGEVLFKKQQLDRLCHFVSDYFLMNTISEEDKSLLESHISREANGKSGVLRVTAHAPERESLLSEELNFDLLKWSFNWREPLQVDDISLKTFFSPFTFAYPKLKMGSYMPHFYFKKQAKKLGYDDGAFIYEGKLIEACTSNIFFGKGEKLFTPKEVIYPGLTRELILEEFEVNEIEIMREDIKQFDFCFISNSAQIVTSVKAIDDIRFNRNNRVRDIKNIILKKGLE
jgi:4-amino-4-deoxychorismate lyase